MRFPSFLNGSYQSQSLTVDQEDLINWYVERTESPGATSDAALYPTPGVSTWSTPGVLGSGRGLFSLQYKGNERCFGVVGVTFYEFYDGLDPVDRGTVASDSNPVSIVSNGDAGGQIFISSGDNGYNFDLETNTLTNPLTSGVTKVGISYGYFVAFDAAASSGRISDLFDGTTWDPTQDFSRSIGPDPWLGMHITPYGYICLPGRSSGEFWYNAGTFPFPFAPDPSGLFSWGIAAPFSIAQVGSSVMWLGRAPAGGNQVVSATGFAPQRVSTPAIAHQIHQYSRVDDAIGQSYTEDGHTFFLLTFPSANITLCLDVSTGLWHKRGTWISSKARYASWEPVFHTFAFDKHLMMKRETGVVYQVSNAFPLDVDDRPIRRLRRTPALVDEHKRLMVPECEILLEPGLGVSSGQGSDPLVMLRVSDDGGRTFGTERTSSAGPQGQYQKRVVWWKLGQARNRVFEVVVTDPIVNWRIVDAYLTIERAA